MKKILFSILCAFMVCTMASAQYLNVKLKDGTYHSYKTSSDMEVSFGEKKEVGTINGHAYVELAGYKWATQNVGSVENGQSAVAADPTYGLYYTQANDNAKLAAESWGATWTLPTEEHWKALMDENNCTWTWQGSYSFDGKTMKGYIVSDKKDSSKFIFLPAAGICDDGGSFVLVQRDVGCYWSADHGRYLHFYDGSRGMHGGYLPDYGMAVRPVSK